jgi:hypothetical protein
VYVGWTSIIGAPSSVYVQVYEEDTFSKDDRVHVRYVCVCVCVYIYMCVCQVLSVCVCMCVSVCL